METGCNGIHHRILAEKENTAMRVIDLSGKIKKGIWLYGDVYPEFHPRRIQVAQDTYFCDVFDGFSSHTGTYLETTAHFNGYEGNQLLQDIDVEELVHIPCYVIHLDPLRFGRLNSPISAADLEQAAGGVDFAPNSAILFSCGWENWDSGDFLDGSPYLTRSAIQWLLSWEPKIIGSDIPAWQGPAEEDVFEIFSKHNSLLLAPLVNLKDAPISGGRLTVLTPNLTDTCCAPARAVLTAEE